jgi:DNA-binding GntR family transcriptional regulator
MPTHTKKEKEGEVERVYKLLREWLVNTKLAPGEFVSEADLANRCKTSRTPVREACNRLAQDKWLSRIRHKGFLVTPISVRDIVDLYEYRKLLESFSAGKVAQSAHHNQISELRDIIKEEANPNASLEEILTANEEFHMRLAEMAGNQRVIDQLRLILYCVQRLDTLCTKNVPGWIGHRDIIIALENRNNAEAAQAMAMHLDLSRDKMIKLFST